MKNKRLCSAGLPLLLCGAVILIALPGEAADGVKQGLSVCGGVIVPSLFPFLVLSRLLAAYGVPELLAGYCGPVLLRLGLSPYAAAPLLIGLLGGYPAGAAALAAECRENLISPKEAERLLPCCNNTGPAFLIGAAGSVVFRSARVGIVLYLGHILSALTVALLLCRAKTTPSAPTLRQPGHANAENCFTESVLAAGETVLHICAFVLFFSALSALLRTVGILSVLSSRFARLSGMGLQASNALLYGLIELGGGIAALSGLPVTAGNGMLCGFLIGFGSLSVHAQTAAVLSGTGIRTRRHFFGKLLHGAFSALYAFLFFTLLQIGK